MAEDRDILPAGYKLKDYTIKSLLGRGGFGITYKAFDEHNKRFVAIKEFYYSSYVNRNNDHITVESLSFDKSKIREYQKFLRKFQNEAKIISKFDHINIVRVTDFFRSNNTAYFVMIYEEGETLEEYLKQKGFINEEEILSIIIPVLEGLKHVHQYGFLHRDIKPDNIYLRQDSLPMLIDFGSTRYYIGEETKSLTAIATAGYAPPEQYSNRSKQTPATDIYSVGATIYTMITGKRPPDANYRQYERLNNGVDPYKKLANIYTHSYSQEFLQSVDRSLSLQINSRQRSIESFQKELLFKNSQLSKGKYLIDIINQKEHHFKELDIYKFIEVILKNLKSKEISTQSITTENLFIDKNNNISINFQKTISPIYLAPELYFSKNNYSESSDVYSIGAIIYHMITKEMPPNGRERQMTIFGSEPDILVGFIEKYKHKYSKELLEIVEQALVVPQHRRLQTIDELEERLGFNRKDENNSFLRTLIQFFFR